MRPFDTADERRTTMQLSDVMHRLAGPGTSVEFRAYDGSRSGPPDAAVRVGIRSPRALTYLVTSPGELGLARAYVSGDLEIEGDLYDALRALAHNQMGQLSWAKR